MFCSQQPRTIYSRQFAEGLNGHGNGLGGDVSVMTSLEEGVAPVVRFDDEPEDAFVHRHIWRHAHRNGGRHPYHARRAGTIEMSNAQCEVRNN